MKIYLIKYCQVMIIIYIYLKYLFMEQSIKIKFNGLCSKTNPSICVCSDILCYQSAFICQQQSCPCLKHPHCQKMSTKQLQQKLQAKLLPKKQEIEQNGKIIESLYDDLIEKLSLDRLRFIQSMNYYGLKDYSAKLMNLINETEFDKINGRLIALVNQQLRRPDMKNLLSSEQINKYKKNLQKNFETFRDQLKIITVKLQAYQQQMMNIDMSTLGTVNISYHKIFVNYLDGRMYSFKQYFDAQLRLETVQKVNLYSAQLRQFPKFLTYTLNLTTLQLNYNKIKNIENLENLTNLRILNLGNNRIEEMKNLNKLQQLRHLFLFGNLIKKVDDIDKLYFLQILNLNNNPLKDVNMLVLLPKINKIYLEQCNEVWNNHQSQALLHQLSKRVLIKGKVFI